MAELETLQQSLLHGPDQEELLHRYFQLAVEFDRVHSAQEFLDNLQQAYRWNHALRRIRIALCLHQKNYWAAMAIVETLVAFTKPEDGLLDSALAIREKLGPLQVEAQPGKDPTISLCMIVRDEQRYLAPCLNSAKGLVDEIIVVDTGSKDRSADIARLYGAKVYHETWQDDFAQARNASLEKASGDWILVLDADEAIARQDFNTLRQMIAFNGKTTPAFSIKTRNYIHLANAMEWQANDGRYPQQEAGIGWFPTSKVRLFPNNDAVRFDYPVHEMVDMRAKDAGLAIQQCPVPVHHYGHLNEANNQRKAEHYFKLGYDKLDQLGNSSAALRELAVQAGQLGYWKEAIELWQQLLAVCPGYYEAYANLAGAHWNIGQYDQGVVFSKKAIQINSDLKEGHYNLAVNLIMKGAAEEALPMLKRIVRKDARYLPARFMLAVVLCIVQRHEQGTAAFSALGHEISPQVLSIALEDVMNKLETSGRSDYAEAIKMASGSA